MFKSKLQDVCQKKAWSLPEYTSTKEGLDHDPRFSATVVVSGLTFNAAQSFRSSKLAQNDAACIAFHHFSSPPPAPAAAVPPGGSRPLPSGFPLIAGPGSEWSCTNMPQQLQEPQAPQVIDNATVCGSQSTGRTLNVEVTIDGRTYQGQEFLPTMKDAEHAAAKVALLSLLPDGAQEDDSGLYKNLLQELLQKEGQHAPLYSTTTSGEPHMRSFVSTVEIRGEYFTGQVARSKKLAEVSAAKVAYNTLRDRKSSQIPLFLTPVLQGREGPEVIYSHALPVVAADLQQQVRPNSPKIPILDSVTGARQSEISVATMGTNHPSATLSPRVNLDVGGGSTPPGNVHGLEPKTSHSASPVSQNGSLSTLPSDHTSDMDPTLEPPAKRLFTNKVTVYPRMAVTLPEDCTVLPISDENWIAVSHNVRK
ncbi:double-stranded RNA-binding protein 1-like isoform X2 [Argentina anserina]|uniref:double-stranded RNA-binding protein 1-like isoform X2 n=1 Tax=Argentina anserina TaxID=57926 RepID=UPI0021768181|nr:double-stranded RNA-binding protein 1-like isoform X2 [Potentilla anserina]